MRTVSTTHQEPGDDLCLGGVPATAPRMGPGVRPGDPVEMLEGRFESTNHRLKAGQGAHTTEKAMSPTAADTPSDAEARVPGDATEARVPGDAMEARAAAMPFAFYWPSRQLDHGSQLLDLFSADRTAMKAHEQILRTVPVSMDAQAGTLGGAIEALLF